MSAEFRPVPLPPHAVAHSAVHIDPVHELLSGEAVAIDVQPVGVVFRALGALIDIAVSFAVLLLFGWLTSWAGELGVLSEAATRILMVVTIVISLVVLPCTIEVAMRGRSLGKLAIGGRVVRTDGGAITMRHTIIRALTGVLETYMTLGAVAIAAGAFSPRSQRLGDLLAGTYCQRVRTKPPAIHVAAVPPQLQAWAQVADVAMLPDRLGRRITQFLAHAPAMAPAARLHVATTLLAEADPYVSPVPEGHPELALQAMLAVRREREARALRNADARVARLSAAVRGRA
jgi:uncharacterized RDD family membrane protein YckC